MRYNRYASYAPVRNERKRLGGLSVKLNALSGKKALRYFAQNLAPFAVKYSIVLRQATIDRPNRRFVL